MFIKPWNLARRHHQLGGIAVAGHLGREACTGTFLPSMVGSSPRPSPAREIHMSSKYAALLDRISANNPPNRQTVLPTGKLRQPAC